VVEDDKPLASEGKSGLKPLTFRLVHPGVIFELSQVCIVGTGPGLDMLALVDKLCMLAVHTCKRSHALRVQR
jgi:hypothetical protein